MHILYVQSKKAIYRSSKCLSIKIIFRFFSEIVKFIGKIEWQDITKELEPHAMSDRANGVASKTPAASWGNDTHNWTTEHSPSSNWPSTFSYQPIPSSWCSTFLRAWCTFYAPLFSSQPLPVPGAVQPVNQPLVVLGALQAVT